MSLKWTWRSVETTKKERIVWDERDCNWIIPTRVLSLGFQLSFISYYQNVLFFQAKGGGTTQHAPVSKAVWMGKAAIPGLQAAACKLWPPGAFKGSTESTATSRTMSTRLLTLPVTAGWWPRTARRCRITLTAWKGDKGWEAELDLIQMPSPRQLAPPLSLWWIMNTTLVIAAWSKTSHILVTSAHPVRCFIEAR